MKHIYTINRILLGLVMLVPGLYKLYGMVTGNPFAVSMLSGLGFPAPTFFAWILILSEIIFGVAILANYKLKYTVWPPIIILVVAAFTVWLTNVAQILVHLALASNFLVWGMSSKMDKKSKK